MTFELGVYTFGNMPRTADGGYRPTAQAIREVLEAIHLAEEVGLDGGMPHATFLKAIELLGTQVPPLIRKELE